MDSESSNNPGTGERSGRDDDRSHRGGFAKRRGRGYHSHHGGHRGGGGRGQGYRTDGSYGHGNWRNDGARYNSGRGGGGQRHGHYSAQQIPEGSERPLLSSYENSDPERFTNNLSSHRGHHRAPRGVGRGGGTRHWKSNPNQQYENENRQHSDTALNPMATPFEPRLRDGGNDNEIDQSDLNEQTTMSNSRRARRGGFNKDSGGRRSYNNSQNDDRFPEHKRKVSDGKSRNQREVLIDQLSRNVYECMVCCEKVRASQPIWSCKRCFNIFHLSCIRKWASSSVDENGWRCPGCQSYCDASPSDYYCFCGKVKSPKTSRHDTPHTCGQLCGKPNPGGLKCIHNCIVQCHPGPCPSCEVQQKRYCGCGKTSAQVLCGSKSILSCDSVCNKRLECGAHYCTRNCHPGDCDPCEATVTHECHCLSARKEVPCTLENNKNKSYSCAQLCGKRLRCGFHTCEAMCHLGSCAPCKTAIEAVLSCPCGQTPISEACKIARVPERKKCTDPIPTCGKICQRILPCGDPSSKHRCPRKCHLESVCPPCDKTSSVKCRCGSKTMDKPCKELSNGEDITCQKKCTKKKNCGKHKCNSKCCIDVDHICAIVCQRQLRCGLHNCTSLCHLNPCPPCGVVSFDELPCECGASIIYPPVPCGTRRPPCQLPCSRDHSCDHPVHHPCHSEQNCPPCTVLTEKWCHGKHEVSCGLPCAMELSCSRHGCPKICHAGPCLENGEVCRLPCDKLRDCGHKCGAPCHDDDCPDSKCKITTNVSCSCGRKTETMICFKRDIEYDRTVTWEYHKELKKLEEAAKEKGESADIDDNMKANIMTKMKDAIPKFAVLECDKECAKQERNRKLAEALKVNVDVTTSVGTPNYSEFLTKFAKKNPQFVEMVHKQLNDLVMKAKQSRKKNETYGFNSMNRDKRHVIHEYSDHFGVLSESFDEEPNRNVVCFASKEKSYLPSVPLIDVVFRPAVRSERRKPQDDVTFHPEKRTQIVGPSNWKMKPATTTSMSQVVTLNIPGSSNQSADFPPL